MRTKCVMAQMKMRADKREMLNLKISVKKKDITSKFSPGLFFSCCCCLFNKQTTLFVLLQKVTTLEKSRTADYFQWEMAHAVSSE